MIKNLKVFLENNFRWCKQEAVNRFGYFAIGTIVITIVVTVVAGFTGGQV